MNDNKDISNKNCPKCGKPLEIRHGEYGTYLDCTGYPECKFTQNISNKRSINSTKGSRSLNPIEH